MADDDVISTQHLSKRFGKQVAVSDLELQVKSGEIYGFLGPNGAGKTTTILLILGLLRPDQGEVRLFGRPLKGNDCAARRRVGVMSEHPYLYYHMTAWEYLSLFGDLYAVPRKEARIAAMLKAVDLYDRRHSCLREYSHGMRQKIGLARALLHDPELLVLDEPTAGLDPHGVKQVREILLAERARGKTILISSHILSEVERTADRVGVLVRGRLQAQDAVEALIRRGQGETVVEIELYRPLSGLVARLQGLPFVRRVEADGPKLTVHLPPAGGADYHAELSAAIGAAGGTIVGMATRKGSLEDAFLTISEADVAGWQGEASDA